MSRRLSSVLAVGIAVVMLAVLMGGCGGGKESSDASSAEARRGGVFQLAIESDPASLTPATSIAWGEVIGEINQPLFRQNEKGVLEPFLATGMKTSSNGLIYTVSLRQDVKFSSGKPMTAKDVVFSLEQASKSPYYESLYEPIKTIEATSPSTVKITTTKPMAAMKADLSLWLSGIVPEGYEGQSANQFGQHPVGTGPFTLKSWKHGEAIKLVRNPHYWEPKQPLLNELVFRIVPEDNSREAQLRGGEANAIGQPANSQIKTLEQTPGLTTAKTPSNHVNLLLLNVKNPLFRDPRAREAVDLAVDRVGIVKVAAGGLGEPGGSFLPPILPFWDESLKPPARDVAKAKQLLAEAIDATGASPKVTLITWNGYSFMGTAAEIIQQDLNEIGFDVKLRPLDISAGLAAIEAGEFDASMDAYYSASPDPSELTAYFLYSLARPSGVETAELSKLAEEAAAELDERKREHLYAQIQELVAKQDNAIVLNYEPAVLAMQDSVAGLELSPLGIPWFMRTGFAS